MTTLEYCDPLRIKSMLRWWSMLYDDYDFYDYNDAYDFDSDDRSRIICYVPKDVVDTDDRLFIAVLGIAY